MDENGGLTSSQQEMVLQFQDFTGIDDLNICRDVLMRHQWNLEVAIQEQLNIREGRPSVYATESRPPAVINDRYLQHVFSNDSSGSRGGFFQFVYDYIVNFFYSNIMFLINFFKGGTQERIVTDPLGDVHSFIQSYNEKFPEHPVFYQGTYAQALNDAKRHLKFLLVYLHSSRRQDAADVTNLCGNALSNTEVIEYINRNCLFWGCDVASPEGYRVSHSINARTYPIMVIVGLRWNKMIIMGRMEGDCSAEELLRRLQTIVTDNEVWLNQARTERLERSLTQSLRQQQDEAYELSLRADQEKERQRQMDLEKEMKIQQAIEAERRAEEEKKENIARLKIELASEVPSEPSPTDVDVLMFVFKLPNGARPERRFRKTDTIRSVYNFIFCHPSSPDHFEITTNFPKRVLYSDAKETNISPEATIASVGLQNREVLFINDLDA